MATPKRNRPEAASGATPWERLAEPFDPWDLEWRVGNVAKSGKRATLLAYLTSRAVMDRLDAVLGPENWRDEYTRAPEGGVLCTLYVRVGGEWIAKQDAAENTAVEAVKGGVSGALKRAAVKYGVGRYLYHLDAGWHEIRSGWANGGDGVNVTVRGQGHVGWCATPTLPKWALPGGTAAPAPEERERPVAGASGADPAHHPSFDDAERAWFFGSLPQGLTYQRIKAWCAEKGEPPPSSWDHERRQRFLTALFLGQCRGLYEAPAEDQA